MVLKMRSVGERIRLGICIAMLSLYTAILTVMPSHITILLSVVGLCIAMALEPRSVSLVKPLSMFIAIYIAMAIALSFITSKPLDVLYLVSIALRIMGIALVALTVILRAPLHAILRSCNAISRVVLYALIGAKIVAELIPSIKELLFVAKLNYGARNRYRLYSYVAISLILTALIKVVQRFELWIPIMESLCIDRVSCSEPL